MAFVYVSVWNGRKIRSPFLSITSSTATCAKVHIQSGIRLPKSYHNGSPDNHWVLKPETWQVGLSSSIPNGANGAATLWVLSTLPTDRLLDLLNTPLSVPSEGSPASV
ncbi:hypothetical protein IG631_18043 [Alternaria alternata]|nr:hypothetical protein IG631_18043 [Alternaria alternata]